MTASETKTETIRITTHGSTGMSGGRKSWIKHVTEVDGELANGYAFTGQFLDYDTEYDLPIGSVVIDVIPEGSQKIATKSCDIYVVTKNGLKRQSRKSGKDWQGDFLTICDSVSMFLDLAAKTETTPTVHDFSEFSDYEIMAEVKKRGLVSRDNS